MTRPHVEIRDGLHASTTQECQHHAVLYSRLNIQIKLNLSRHYDEHYDLRRINITWLPNKNVVATFCFRNKFDMCLSNNMKWYNHGRCNKTYINSRLRGSFRKCTAIKNVRKKTRQLAGNLMPLISMPGKIKSCFHVLNK